VDVDAGYAKAYNRDNYTADWKLYVRRKIDRSGFKLGIGLPIAGRRQVNDFWISFILTEKPDYILLIPRMEIYEFPSDIASIRNDLAKQALEHGCSHLIMMDTDQVYPQDTIPRMLAHDKDIVGATVHRRYPPFAPILYRGEQGNYRYVPDDEMYSGELIEVDATGTGCILYKTKVFLDVDYPWFVIGKDPKTGKTIGEDIGLCIRLREKGYRIYVDTSLDVDHLSTFRVNRATYELFKKFSTNKGGQGQCHQEASREKIVR
jgi:GT2 family glycosyltransferase